MSQTVGALQNRNELIVSGVPFRVGGNLNEVLRHIGKHLGVSDNINAEPRRMKSSSNLDRDGLTVVEFGLKTTRDDFYSAYLHKRDLKLKHIGVDSDRRIYVNESLTVEARKLKSMALHLKKAGKLASVYTKQGIIHVKATAGGPAIVIQSADDLEKYS